MGQTSSKRSRKSARMRRRILEAAFELIADKGMDKVSVREIVQKVKVTKPVLYYYFKDKNDFCEQMFAQGVENFKEAMRNLRKDSASIEDTVAEILKRNLQCFKRKPKIALLMLRMIICGCGKNEFAGLIGEVKAAKTAIFRDILKEAELRGEIPRGSADDMLLLISALLNHFMINLHREPEIFDSKLPQRLAKIIVSGARAAHGNR